MPTDKENPRSRLPLLHVVDLLSTNVQSVCLEVGPRNTTVPRLGTALVYLPVLVIGYMMLLVSALRFVAIALGWGVTLLLFGAVHVAVSLWGVTRGREIGAATVFEVVDPNVVAPDGAAFAMGANRGRGRSSRPRTPGASANAASAARS